MDELIIGLISILLVIAGMVIYYFIFIRDKNNGIDIPQQKHVPPMPPVKEYGRRCSECNWPLTNARIYLVREDSQIGGITAAISGTLETELKEAINCPICGHQNIIGKFYRPLETESQNDIRRAAGFEPVETLEPYDITATDNEKLQESFMKAGIEATERALSKRKARKEMEDDNVRQ